MVFSYLHMLWFAVLALFAGANAHAQPTGRGPNAIAVQLVGETAAPAAGEEVMLALVMKPSQGWHGYWKNPGDAGLETKIAWDLPEGASVGVIRYPVPSRLTVSGLVNYVFEGEYAHLIPLRIPARLAPGTRLPIRATVDYLACTDRICVPEQAEVALELKVGGPDARPARDAKFDEYRRALPRPLSSEARFDLVGKELRLAIPIPASLQLDDPYFFPARPDLLDHSAPQSITRQGNLLLLVTQAGRQADASGAIEGIFKFGDGQGLAVTARRGAVPAPPAAVAADRPQTNQSSIIMLALLGALAGGLILNVMPCVFPILSLKALSLARAGADEGAARSEALAYSAGVILTCLTLGGLLLGLRASGVAAGWAFQLQDPRMILLLLLLVSAIALNLAGLYDLPALGGGERLAARGGVGGAFWTGALAAFIATPCTGPFMGAALGAALVLPGPAALAIFAGLGLGLALPFLLLGFVPRLRRLLPRPGPWMASFRRWLSLPMFLTAFALAWILGRQAGSEGLILGLAAALVLAIALWWLGSRHHQRRAWLPLVPAAIAAGAAVVMVPTTIAPASTPAQNLLQAEAFSEPRLAALRAQGRPVFVYFTADWCLSCKVNERAVLARPEVAKRFSDHKVSVLVGDWTRGDIAIGRFLESHGRSGIPLYLYYAPGKPVEVLPQILSPARIAALTA